MKLKKGKRTNKKQRTQCYQKHPTTKHLINSKETVLDTEN